MGLIVSLDTVKPCSPTPPSLRDYKLSHMDQLFRHIYPPILLFYSNSTTTTVVATDHGLFKKALSETLTHMYPFAGRVRHDGMSIDCNDDGAEYIVTRINESMSTVLENPCTHFLQQLLPLNLSPSWLCSSTGSRPPLVALQINHFSCGGVAIGACIGHAIADASGAAAFLQMWAAIISHGDNRMHVLDKVGSRNNFIFSGRTTLYPPLDNTVEGFDFFSKEINSCREPQVSKLLVVDGPKVDALKEKVGLKRNPTRVQTVMAFIWAALISASQDRNQELEMHSLSTVVNIRNKMEPPLPACSMGNIVHGTLATWNLAAGDRAKVEMDELVPKLKESIEMVTEDLVREEHGDPNQFINNFMARAVLQAASSSVESYDITSWCRFPYYEIDFGWGKPVWVATLATINNFGILIDASDCKGIQAWLRVRSQDMAKLEKDPGFLAYVSAIHTL